MNKATISDVEAAAIALVSMIVNLGEITEEVDVRLSAVDSVIQEAIQETLSQ